MPLYLVLTTELMLQVLLFLALTKEGKKAVPAVAQPLPPAPEPEDAPELDPELLALLAQEMHEASLLALTASSLAMQHVCGDLLEHLRASRWCRIFGHATPSGVTLPRPCCGQAVAAHCTM